MLLKDYYSILGLKPGASPPEIKSAYRNLAMQFHPDKTDEDMHGTARFHEIREAYEVLINPSRKKKYLEQRWEQQSMGRKFSGNKPLTPETILSDAIALNRHTRSLNSFWIDVDQLNNYLEEYLNENTIAALNHFNDSDINEQVISISIETIRILPVHLATIHLSRLSELTKDEKTRSRLRQFMTRKRQDETLRKYELPAILIATLLLCLLIWLAVQ